MPIILGIIATTFGSIGLIMAIFGVPKYESQDSPILRFMVGVLGFITLIIGLGYLGFIPIIK